MFKRKNGSTPHPVLDAIWHHLYVCHTQNRELQRHLRFRDCLRQNEQARKTYESLKYAIAERAGHDPKTYAALKETEARAFIESVLKELIL